MATFQHGSNPLRTLLGAFLPADSVAFVPTIQLSLASVLAHKLALFQRAGHHLQVATLGNSFLYYHLAWCTLLETRAGTAVPICTKHLLTRLQTLVVFVLQVVGVADPCANMPTAQPELTGESAASFWDLVEVCCCCYWSLDFRVVLTAKRQ